MNRPCLIFDTEDARSQKLAEIEALDVVRPPYAAPVGTPIAKGPHQDKYYLLIEEEVRPFVDGPFVEYSSEWRPVSDMV